jgi:hypothetical protein
MISLHGQFKFRSVHRLTLGGMLLTVLLMVVQTASAANSIQTVDSTGGVGLYTSLALDASGNPVFSYWDFTNSELQFAHCDDPNCAGGGEALQMVDTNGAVGLYTSLELDASGLPVISYYNIASGNLLLVHCNDANCDPAVNGAESPEIADSSGDVGQYSSLELDANGYPVVSYYYNGGDLQLVHCADPNCSEGGESVEVVDLPGSVGTFTSLKLDSSGFPVISYYDATNKDLKLAHCNDANCDPAVNGAEFVLAVDSTGNVGEWTSLALDSSGFPVISYYDASNKDLKVVHCNDANCNPMVNGAESPQTVDSTDDVGQFTSLVLDSSGNPVISYYDETNTDLKLATCDDADCAGDNESLLTVDSTDDVGSNTSLVLDASGFPVISYFDNTSDDVKLAHCDNTLCVPSFTLTVDGSGTGSGSVSGGSLSSCTITAGVTSGTCTDTETFGTVITLTATADAGSTFTGWSGGGCSGTDPCDVTLSSDTTVTATFQLNSNMHVSQIIGATQATTNKWTAFATVEIVDYDGIAVPDVTVAGQWQAGNKKLNVSCITGVDGQCFVQQTGLKLNVASSTFTVTSVTGGALPYDSGANVLSSLIVNQTDAPYPTVELHVGNLSPTVTEGGKSWKGTITVLAVAANGQPIPKVKIAATLTVGTKVKTVNCTTGTNGTCIIKFSASNTIPSISLDVVSLTLAPYTYNAGANVITHLDVDKP